MWAVLLVERLTDWQLAAQAGSSCNRDSKLLRPNYRHGACSACNPRHSGTSTTHRMRAIGLRIGA